MADAPGTSTAAAADAPSDNSEGLYKAIQEDDLETFLDLLHQPGVDLNYKQGDKTPLTASIETGNSRMAKHLIEAGCDVNLRNDDGNSPLDLALIKRPFCVYKLDVILVKMLLCKGVDPNVHGHWNLNTSTFLHYAIHFHNLEVTSILLYYGADVNITNGYNQTPLHMAVVLRRNSCAELLLNYYDDFSNRRYAARHTVLHDAILNESPLVPTLLERGADINWLDGNGKCSLYQTECHRNAKTFKDIWSRINHHLLMKTYIPFLLSYIEDWKFENGEYLECLDLMLESPIAHNLIDHCIDYLHYNGMYLVKTLLYNFRNRKILPKDILSAIYTCLSFGIEIGAEDLLFAMKNYGFNEEFKALLYAGDFYQLNCYDCIVQIKYFKQWKEDFYLKGFSSFSFENKQHAKAINKLLATSSRLESETMLEALSKVPKFPSLLELSRNEVQKFIEQEFPVTKLYQFYDVVSYLELPQSMKDVILLEKPIYDDVTIIK